MLYITDFRSADRTIVCLVICNSSPLPGRMKGGEDIKLTADAPIDSRMGSGYLTTNTASVAIARPIHPTGNQNIPIGCISMPDASIRRFYLNRPDQSGILNKGDNFKR